MTKYVPTRAQATSARALANATRSDRKKALGPLKELPQRDARNLAASYVADPPDALKTMKLTDLLARVPYMNANQSGRIVNGTGTPPLIELRSIPVGKRIELAAAIRGERRDLGLDLQNLPLASPPQRPSARPGRVRVTDEEAAIAHDALREIGWDPAPAWPDLDRDARRALRTALNGVLNP